MNYLGEFDVKADAKGRIKLPTALLRQFQNSEYESFVVNRGFEGCLVLYTKTQWDLETIKLNKLNNYNKQHRRFVRQLFRGATELKLDAQNRILIPKTLSSYANIEKEVVLFAHLDKVEIWDKASYEEELDIDANEYAEIADNVMSFLNEKNDD